MFKLAKETKSIGYMLISLILSTLDESLMFQITIMINSLLRTKDITKISKASIVIVSMSLVLNLIRHFQITFNIGKIFFRIRQTISKNILNKVLTDMDYNQFIEHDSGKIINVIMHDSDEIADGLSSIVDLCAILINLSVICVQLSFMSMQLSYVMIGYIIVILLIFKYTLNKIKASSEERRLLTKYLIKNINHVILDYNMIKNAGNENEELKKSYSTLDKCTNENLKIKYLMNRMYQIRSIAYTTSSLILVVVGIILAIDVITIVSFVAVAQEMFSSLLHVLNSIESISVGSDACKNYYEIINIESTVKNGTKEFKFDKKISIQNVSFGYNDNKILNDLNIKIKKGEHIGFCGESGCGKSTLMKLITRNYDVSSGNIKYDDIDIKDFNTSSLKKSIAVVDQNNDIMDGTISENISYGCGNVSMKEIMDAAKRANIHDFICSLSDGYNSMIGEKGIKLSGGQRQRIVIARAFLKNPDIFIFDEATSALDNECEKIIKESIDSLRDKTVLVIAHRLSTIKDMDKIYVFNKGKICESGDYDSLMNKKGKFYSLANI